MGTMNRSRVVRHMLLVVPPLVGMVILLGVAGAVGSSFTEQWAESSSPYFTFLPNGGSSISSNVTDAAAQDGKAVALTLPANPGTSPGNGPNLQSSELYGFGTYEARLKTADCSAQPNSGIISGFFTYLNDGNDLTEDGISDNSEIDFEWLCAEPNVIWLTMWTDFQESPLAMKRVYRELDLATGEIRRTCYSEGYGLCTEDLTGSATEGQPSAITPIAGYNSSSAYYTYGFTWAADRMTWYVYNPSNNQKIILWDYNGPSSRIPQRPSYYMFNVWHTSNWPPTNLPNAVEKPNSARSMLIDWVHYDPSILRPGYSASYLPLVDNPVKPPTPTITPGGPTLTPTPTSTPTATKTATRTPTATLTPVSGNLLAGKLATGSTDLNNPALATDGDKNTGNFAGQDLGAHWIQFDLGQSYQVNKVNLWHYFGDGRTYHDVIVQLSGDAGFATATTVFNNDADNSAGQGTGTDAEYAETSGGKEITFTPVAARYLRFWINGSSSNAYNHYVEAEAYAE
jgi:hypothetical protein